MARLKLLSLISGLLFLSACASQPQIRPAFDIVPPHCASTNFLAKILNDAGQSLTEVGVEEETLTFIQKYTGISGWTLVRAEARGIGCVIAAGTLWQKTE